MASRRLDMKGWEAVIGWNPRAAGLRPAKICTPPAPTNFGDQRQQPTSIRCAGVATAPCPCLNQKVHRSKTAVKAALPSISAGGRAQQVLDRHKQYFYPDLPQELTKISQFDQTDRLKQAGCDRWKWLEKGKDTSRQDDRHRGGCNMEERMAASLMHAARSCLAGRPIRCGLQPRAGDEPS